MTFKNPSHHSSILEHPSFSEPEQEESLQEKQIKPELARDPKNEEHVSIDTTEKDEALIGEIKNKIEESSNKHDRGLEHMQLAVKKNREDIKRINYLKRAAGESVTQPKKDSLLGRVKSFFRGKSE